MIKSFVNCFFDIVDSDHADDPVYYIAETKEWWFFDETWSNVSGPYVSEAECREALTLYGKTM